MIFIPVIYVIFGFCPYKIFGLICILVNFFFPEYPLPYPTQQIRLRGADLTFFQLATCRKTFPHHIF